MQTVGIICEYNPFHLGHKKQMDMIRGICGPETAIVCLMSGNFVQRGHPAIFDKLTRARAALAAGANLVLELPVSYALSSAEGFAAGGVRLLSGLCDRICFGSESGDAQALMDTARLLLQEDTWQLIRENLEKGLSFPAARQKALEGRPLSQPNDILAVEYCKAILIQGSGLQPLVIRREGSYHDQAPDRENPSATALRLRMEAGQPWQSYTPEASLFENAPLHTLKAGEKAMLCRLRTLSEAEFAQIPHGSEGLWRKFMHNCRQEATLEAILETTKSKRYTRTRLDRMAMCAFLGLTEQDLSTPAPYARVLGLEEKGRAVLNKGRENLWLPNIGERIDHPFQQIEARCDALYGLFAEIPDPPEPKYRVVFYKK